MRAGLFRLAWALLLAGVVSATAMAGVNLPTDPVDATYFETFEIGEDSFFDVILSGVGPGYDVSDGVTYIGWCVDPYSGPPPYDEDTEGTILKSSYASDLPIGYLFYEGSTIPWDKINYLLNHKNGAVNNEIQPAIWYFVTGQRKAWARPGWDCPVGSVCDQLVAAADAFGAGFVPGPDQVTAVILTNNGIFGLGSNGVASLDDGWQDIIIEVPVPVEELGCRFTGGGVDTDGNWDHMLESGEMIRNGTGHLPDNIDRYQFGGQAGANTGQPPQPKGEWQHHQQKGPSGAFLFHGGTASAADGTEIVEIRCSDPGFCFPARPAPAKQLDFDGIGTFSHLPGNVKWFGLDQTGRAEVPFAVNARKESNRNVFTFHWFEVNIDDAGEPGRDNSGASDPDICPGRGFGEKSAGVFVPDPVTDPDATVLLPATELADCRCPDFYRITIYNGVDNDQVTYLPDGSIDPASLDRTNVIYEVFGFVDGGNLQIHPPTGYDE
jgi:hypothetical protein